MSENIRSSVDLIQFKSEQRVLKALTHLGFRGEYAIALWKLPYQNKKHLIVDFSKGHKDIEPDIEELPGGFLFTPFEQDVSNIFLHADLAYSSGEDFQINIRPGQNVKSEELEHQIFKHLNNGSGQFSIPDCYLHSNSATQLSHDQYIELVQHCMAQIKKGNFLKAVPARIKVVGLSQDFDLIDNFIRLCNSYPSAFVSLIAIPDVGIWLGATPELLIQVNKENFFTTSSLAGTKTFSPDIPLHEVTWTQKEIEEQAIVSRYIINCFKTIRLREFEEDGPKTVKAGNLVHLRTDFTVDMQATNFLNLGSVMLKLLHPTSAVCGMPKQPALDFLRSHERIDREFFSGYLGPVNFNSESHLYVNLRCMQINEQVGLMYAGAGVTAFSLPEREWQETEIKFQTLLEVIKL